MPRASAAICEKIVFVPWPISVLAARMRTDAFGRRFDFHDGREIYLARPGKPRAVHERSEADAALHGRAGIFSREALALGVIIAFPERAIEQAVEVHVLVDHLPGRGGLAFVEKLRRRNSSGVRFTARAT